VVPWNFEASAFVRYMRRNAPFVLPSERNAELLLAE
jgi:hypothetical protein